MSLDGTSLASHIFQHVGRHSLSISYCKKSCLRCLSRLGAQVSAITAFNLLAAQRCVLHTQWLSSSVCQVVAGVTRVPTRKVYQQCLMEWAGYCAQEGIPNNATSASKLAEFVVHLFKLRLVWHTIGTYHSVISTFLEPQHHLHEASNHHIISKLMHHFYLHHPPSM